MSDWAEDKAREWRRVHGIRTSTAADPTGEKAQDASLAVLLREVREQPPDQFGACDRCHGQNISVLLCPKCDGKVCGLAEVRRVCEDVRARWATFHSVAPAAVSEVLSRLEKL